MRIAVMLVPLLTAQAAMAQKIERINPPGLSTPTTYSHIVKVGDILYIAGQVGADAQGKIVGSGMAEQVEQVLKNLLSNAFKFTEKGGVELSVGSVTHGCPTAAMVSTGSVWRWGQASAASVRSRPITRDCRRAGRARSRHSSCRAPSST